MKTIAGFVAGMFLSVATLWPALAEDVSHEQIIDALKPKVKTRAIGSTGGLSASEKEFISGLRAKTRAITVVEREELAIIVKENELPAIDLEIYFDYDSADITPKANPGLIELGVAIRSDDLKGALFLVSGHTDATGSDDYNQSLSERRAESVMRFLTESFSVPSDQLLAIGYGEEQLKNTGAPDAAENRRVTIVNLIN